MNSMLPYKEFRVHMKRYEAANVNTLIFDRPLGGAIPGQFVMVWLPGIGEKPFCVADDDPFSLTVAVAGDFSRALHSLDADERVWVRGPYGQGYVLSGERHMLIGGGYGVAPLLYLAKQAVRRGQAVMACLGARSAVDIILAEAFRQAGCELRIATEDGSLGRRGMVTQVVEAALVDLNQYTLYACGPLPMLSAIAGICRHRQLPAQLSYEALMRCGLGLCGSCELDDETRDTAGIQAGWLTCKDGPVFFMNSEIEK